MEYRAFCRVGFVLLAAAGCVSEDVDESQTTSAALTTRFNGVAIEVNVAQGGFASSSGAYSTQPVSFINDGYRGSPYDLWLGQYRYWASSTTSTVYNCNYGNWWVKVAFRQPGPGELCAIGSDCPRTISEIDLFSLQNNYTSGADPTSSTTTSTWGNVDFHLLYCPEGVTCSANGAGWVQPPGGYIIANNKAWTKVTFPPVRATAVRASLDCAQSTRAYAVELEAWERQPEPTTVPATPLQDYGSIRVTDDNSNANIVLETDRFWWAEFGAYDDLGEIDRAFTINPDPAVCPDQGHYCPGYWKIGRRLEALVYMYDLLEPIDFPRALTYLERLRVMSLKLLEYRDDRRPNASVPAGVTLVSGKPFDPFHNRVMPGWGQIQPVLDGFWTTQVGLAGLYTYGMAAFARRVSDHPERFTELYRQNAIDLTTAVIETYLAFRQDQKLYPADPGPDDAYGYYKHPAAYGSLICGQADSEVREDCYKQQDAAGAPLPWNLSLSNLKAMTELASAADSPLYQSTWAGPSISWYATQEAPLLIARNVNYFVASLKHETLGDGTPWDWWAYKKYTTSIWPWDPIYVEYSTPENLGHGSFTMSSLIKIWERKAVIDGLLARNGYPDRVGLTSTNLTRIANTFLRRIWYYDYNNLSTLKNILYDSVKGASDPDAPGPSLDLALNGNEDCAGYAPLAQVDPWVWVRCRDATFYVALLGGGGEFPARREINHAALLRYRWYWANR